MCSMWHFELSISVLRKEYILLLLYSIVINDLQGMKAYRELSRRYTTSSSCGVSADP